MPGISTGGVSAMATQRRMFLSVAVTALVSTILIGSAAAVTLKETDGKRRNRTERPDDRVFPQSHVWLWVQDQVCMEPDDGAEFRSLSSGCSTRLIAAGNRRRCAPPQVQGPR